MRPLAGGFDSYKVLGDDAELEDGYQSFLPGRCVGELVDPSTALRSLRADSVFEIENVFRQTSGDADASCTVSANGLNRRFAETRWWALVVSRRTGRRQMPTSAPC